MLQTSEVTVTKPVTRPIRWANPNGSDVQRWVTNRLDDGGNLVLSRHAAQERLEQRGFTVEDVYRALLKGHVYRVERGSFAGEYKVNFALPLRGRDAAIAVLVSPSTHQIVVLTVMWVDRTFYK